MTDNANSNLKTGDQKLSSELTVSDIEALQSLAGCMAFGRSYEALVKALRILSASDHQSGPPVDMVPRALLLDAFSLLSAERERAERAIDQLAVVLEDRAKQGVAFETALTAANARIALLTDLLEWMDRKGGLGLDVHDRIRKALTEST